MHGPLNLNGHSISFDRILALDLGKFNSVVCGSRPEEMQLQRRRGAEIAGD